jgi:hypothetical protein
MKYNLERSIRLDSDPKLKGLYTWALQEVGEDGEQIGRDQIPWGMSISFAATELTLHEGHAAQAKYDTSRTWVRAKLTPAKGRHWRRPTFSMFGTEREIGSIQLFVHRLENEEGKKPESTVRVAGWPSFTDTDPLWGGDNDDFIQFDLGLPADEFDRIASRVALGQVDSADFTCHASGFYSEWTPDIETDAYKVLCAEQREQGITIPEGCEIDPPRLGDVRDASFSIQKVIQPRLMMEQLQREAAGDEEPNDWDEPALPAPPPDPRWVKPFAAELKTLKTLIGAVLGVLVLILVLK